MEKEKIDAHQFAILVLMFSVGSSILLIPPVIVIDARQHAWLSAIIGVVLGMLVILVLNALGGRFPHLTPVQYTNLILGEWIGIAVNVCYFGFSWLLTTLVLRNMGDFILTQIFPDTPIEAIHIAFMTIVVMGAILGLQTLARAAQIFFPWLVLLFLLFVMFVCPQMKIENIQPYFEIGLKPLLRASVPLVGLPYMEMILLLMIFPFVTEVKRRSRAMILGGLSGGAVLIICTALIVLVLSPEIASKHIFPTYALAKKVSLGNFMQRMEVVIAIIWFLTIYFKITLCFYIAVTTLADLLNLKEYRPLVLPLGMATVAFSLAVYPNIAFIETFTSEIWPVYAMTFSLFFPLLLLAVSAVRRIPKTKKTGPGKG